MADDETIEVAITAVQAIETLERAENRGITFSSR
jgi:hypothetical protein